MGGKQRVRRAKRRLMKNGSISEEKIKGSISGEKAQGSIGGEEMRAEKPMQATSDTIDFDKNSNEIVSLKRQIETLQTELIQVEKTLTEEHQQTKDLQSKLHSLAVDQDKLKKENSHVKEEFNKLQVEECENLLHLSVAIEEAKLFKAKIPSVMATIEDLEREKNALEDEKEKLEEQKYAAQIEKDAIYRCLEDTQIKFDTAISELSKTVAELREDKNKLQESLNKKDVKLASLQQLFSSSSKKEPKAQTLLKKVFTWPYVAVLSAGVVAAIASFIKIKN